MLHYNNKIIEQIGCDEMFVCVQYAKYLHNVEKSFSKYSICMLKKNACLNKIIRFNKKNM